MISLPRRVPWVGVLSVIAAMLELAIITARGGSVGLPGKNVRLLGGVPLMAWTIRAARASGVFSRIVVSTDDDEIAQVACDEAAEVPFVRPADLCTSMASSTEVVRHALTVLRVEGGFALLQPTSPFRNAEHLRNAAQLFASPNVPAVVSVAAVKPFEWQRRMDEDGRLHRLASQQGEASRRQDAIRTVCPNGAMYITDAATFAANGSLMPPGAVGFRMGSIESVDIDDIQDLRLAEAIVAGGLCRIDL